MAYEYFYPGTPYSLEPEYGELFTGYRIPAGELGGTTSIQTANQIKEVSNLLNQGIKNVEVSTINPEVFDMIPKNQLKEINRLSKLTGSETSLHAPVVEPSGFTQRGWSEIERQGAEKRFEEVIERGHELSPNGNIPVTFHSSAMLPETETRVKEEGKEKVKSVLFVDSRTGEIGEIKETEKFFPEKEEIKEFNPEEEIKKKNQEAWIRSVNDLGIHAARGEDVVSNALEIFKKSEISEDALKIYASENRDKAMEIFSEDQKDIIVPIFKQLDRGNIFLRDSYNMMRELYNRTYKDASEKDKEKLDLYANEIKNNIKEGIEKNPEKMEKFAEIIEKGVKVLGDLDSPNLYEPLNDFLIEKNSETFGNVAFESYKKFGDKTPIISIENPPEGTALSRAEDLKNLIEASRKNFADKLMKEKSLSKSEANAVAEKLIGATWDTSHIAMLRKKPGFGEKELIEEAEKIAPFVKHVHLNDNLGGSHTDLPPGMGSVPMKEILKRFEKAGFKGKKVFEGGNFFQQFQTSPHPYVLEGAGSPVYAMTQAPYWNQMASTYGNYFSFPSAYLPEQHFGSFFGGGFSNLPQELGGQMPGSGQQSKMTGTPMS